MGYWARINGKDYPIAYGWTLSEEFSETLDSASIRLPHIFGKIDVKPYDDVIIHDFDPSVESLPPREFGKIIDVKDENSPFFGHFYKHMLVGNPSCSEVSLAEDWASPSSENAYKEAEKAATAIMEDETLSIEEKAELCKPYAKIMAENSKKKFYNYDIDLVSETKGLEMVQLPNKTISQPIGIDYDNMDDIARAQSTFDNVEYAIPYPMANNWENGMDLDSVWEYLGGVSNKRYAHFAYIGDSDSESVDFSTFGTLPKNVESGVEFMLPDWSVSSITVDTVESLAVLFYWIASSEITQTRQFHPKKHWIIVDNSLAPSSRWGYRGNIINTIENVLNGITYPEVIGHVEDDNAVSTKKFAINLPDSSPKDYDIYLYVEPEIIQLYGNAQANVFGMTSGGSVPTELSRFLLKWSVTCSVDAIYKNKKALSVAEAVRQAVEIFSPYVKVTNGVPNISGGYTWRYERKYRLSENTYVAMSDYIAPENQWSNPNLRDFITRLFYVADCIPVVHDGVIEAMELSKRREDFKLPDSIRSYSNEVMDMSSYCDRLMRVYNDGLSKGNVCKCHDRIGFKNMNSATLTLDNLTLELSHPIYRITKVYMCYYSKYMKNGEPYMRLTKQDITPLVLLSSQRNLLSENWSDFETANTIPNNIEELAKFKYATIGYDIGSKNLTGWGIRYSHPTTVFWDTTRSVIENIYDFVSTKNSFGVYDFSEDMSGYTQDYGQDNFESVADEDRDVMIEDGNGGFDNSEVTLSQLTMSYGGNRVNIFSKYFTEFTQKLKTMVFEIEYDGYISASVIASKDIHDGNVVSRDNASSSLSFVESDGINQKEKANRLGNATITVSARHQNYSETRQLASVWNERDSGGNVIHEDEVLYKKTTRFDVDFVSSSYWLCKNYILRNYFTSVFSRHRPFPLASYEQSVERQENRTMQVLFSPSECYWQNESKKMDFSYDVKKLLSFYIPSSYDSIGNPVIEEGIDSFFYGVYQSDENPYAGQTGFFVCDAQKFVSGNSLCFVVSMKDSVSAGTYVSNFNHNLGAYVGEVVKKTLDLVFTTKWEMSTDALNATQLLTGAKQDWFMFPVDPMTGMMYSMSFSVGFKSNDPYAVNEVAEYSAYNMAQAQLLPLFDAVVKRAKYPAEYVYFGKMEGEYAVGGGYPNIIFTANYNGLVFEDKFHVDFRNRGISYSKANTMIVGSEPPSKFASPNLAGDNISYVERNDRTMVSEFLRAKFVGHETTNSQESDTCVFKDGKERMSMTLQVEPIADSDAVMFSSYMMKLSDVMGGMRKDYDDVENVNSVKLMFGSILIRSKATDSFNDGNYGYWVVSFPLLSICVPKGASISEPLTIEKNWILRNRNNSDFDYHFSLHTIDSIDAVTNVLYATCSYSFGTRGSGDHVSLQFKLKGTSPIQGLSNQGDYPVETIPSISSDYDTFCMIDDRFAFVQEKDIISTHEANFYYKYSNLAQGQSPYLVPDGIDWIKTYQQQSNVDDMLVSVSRSSNITDFDQYPIDFSDSCLIYENNNFGTQSIQIVGGWSNYEIRFGTLNKFIIENGAPLEGKSGKRNMFWVIANEMNKGTSYECLNTIDETIEGFDPEEDIIIEQFGINTFSPISLFHYRRPWRIRIRIPSPISDKRSLRLYYLENNVYHFVFGVNLAPKRTPYDIEDKNFCYPINDSSTEYAVYLSFLDDRSRTVIDENTGDPSYKVANFYEEGNGKGEYIGDGSAFNMCVEK